VIQDFRPLADSLDWELSQLYLHERGSKAFLHDPEPVPFVVNNDGNLSVNAAEVFFASVQAADRAGTLEADVLVLELVHPGRTRNGCGDSGLPGTPSGSPNVAGCPQPAWLGCQGRSNHPLTGGRRERGGMARL
jgi:hypothetical protein